MSLEQFGEKWIKPAGWASLVSNIGIVVTGGAVRLTGSGLGCPTWPRCTAESFTPHSALDVHQLVEFGNRTLTFVLAAIAIFTFVAAVGYRRAHGRSDLQRLALLMGLGIPAQAVVGGITVLTGLSPWVVGLHMVISLIIVALAVVFLFRLKHGPAQRSANRPWQRLALTTYLVTGAVLYVGTVVTGAGPHAGDAKAPRNGLDTLEMSQLHADLVFLLLGLTLAMLFLSTGDVRRSVHVLIGIEALQGVLGFVQYFTDLPIVLVGLHMLGAALTAAAATWMLLAVRREAALPGASANPS